MTDFADLKESIMDWANRQDWSDALVTSYIRFAEQKFNAELRVDRMIRHAENIVNDRCSNLPDNWLQLDLVRIQNPNNPDGFAPLRYKARDEFFNLPDKWAYGYYTLEGRILYVGGYPDATDGQELRIFYYGEVPVLDDENPSWLYTKYPDLYLHAALMHADLHAVGEENAAANMKQLTEDTIQKLNAQSIRAKTYGSRLTRSRTRTFG